ncbi:hypothetical protein A3D81_00685 [Candidatus Curtissbacteria bacterium RIFCSPHIGHO2_02_FULL_40_17]|uniref:HAD family hydrolase n=1 Tax=Candidatus Curtissbacteria bacterium RIFCSPHIGHO2_02_FULL_40_17 TaxID=1797715 RepID=A0A1F5GJW0_9BACT|nr:MAG: hypothetical protein A3D81_00685 [Candidatus Curtissbacteria bacterium RIFCSPHIGHO2_02_FULL_40_17]
MIKAIIFDLGGVLFTDGSEMFINAICKKYGLDREITREAITGEIGSQYRESKITRDEFWEMVREKLNIENKADKLEQMWLNCYKLIEGTKEIILELSKKYKVYYLSDNVKERADWLNKRYGYLKWFAGGVFSHEAGVRKPNIRIYKLVLKKSSTKPKETIYIDDKLWCLKPARKIGIKTILFENPADLRSKLQRFLIN